MLKVCNLLLEDPGYLLNFIYTGSLKGNSLICSSIVVLWCDLGKALLTNAKNLCFYVVESKSQKMISMF